MARKAVIVAAGLSSRLYPLTSDTPKALLPIGDESMLSRSIRLLGENGVSEIGVVTGFRADTMRDAIGESATIIRNPFYRQCNNMGSLLCARHFAGNDPFVYLHGDLAYTGDMLGDFLARSVQHLGVVKSSEHSRGTIGSGSCLDLLVAFGAVDDEAMKVRADGEGHLVESSKSIPLEVASGEWTGIAVVQKPAVVFDAIEKHMMEVGLADYDTAAFTSLARTGNEIRCIPTNGDAWREIDTLEDLEAARAMFGAGR